MDSDRRMTALAGALAVVGTVAGVLSVVPVLETPGYLGLVAAHEGQVLGGALAQLVMIPATVGFALCLYPALRRESAALGLGFVGFRLVAATFHFAGVILLALFLVPGLDDALVGELLRTGRDLVNHVAVVVSLGLGDTLLFCVLHRARLVPRWLSVWGLAAAAPAVLASVLVLVGLTGVVTPLYLLMNAPLGVQSLVLAGWLIAKGFSPRTTATAVPL
ncbi:hypothetical protein BJF78_24485 [Pseudonocardia sp. CNS-139]|nr:hypothetical protein BJF78_24485 [Pseudonocardia sp. CNS-139]